MNRWITRIGVAFGRFILAMNRFGAPGMRMVAQAKTRAWGRFEPSWFGTISYRTRIRALGTIARRGFRQMQSSMERESRSWNDLSERVNWEGNVSAWRRSWLRQWTKWRFVSRVVSRFAPRLPALAHLFRWNGRWCTARCFPLASLSAGNALQPNVFPGMWMASGVWMAWLTPLPVELPHRADVHRDAETRSRVTARSVPLPAMPTREFAQYNPHWSPAASP